MRYWEIAILRTINSLGRNVTNKEVYDRISRFIDLTENDLKATRYGGRPAYVHEIRKYISDLVKSGDLIKIKTGVHSITDKGLKRIE